MATNTTATDLEILATVFKQAEEERYQAMQAAIKEAEKWKAEGNFYGYNFHYGMASGMNWADLYYQRVIRKIDELRGRNE